MKSKKQKYEEAVQRNINSLMQAKRLPKVDAPRLNKYAEASLERRKQMLGIRQSDTTYDKIVSTIV